MNDKLQSESDRRYPWLASMLQTVDPLFPIGSYAHSYGLEEMTAMGKVTNENELTQFLDTIVRLSLSHFELPYLRYTYYSQTKEEWEEVIQLDHEIGASKLSKEARTASATQGRQRLLLLKKLKPSQSFTTLANLQSGNKIAPHHITIFAAERIQEFTPIEATLTAWAYQALAAPCTASLKIMRIGQEGAQRALTQAIKSIPNLISKSLEIERDWAGAFNPLIDIASDRHERAYARLFIS
jgi:urease accessory protein|tara:strand:- start:44 stop:763 length:720 start_codon:yes stop_codon:yes gene_type:complete